MCMLSGLCSLNTGCKWCRLLVCNISSVVFAIIIVLWITNTLHHKECTPLYKIISRNFAWSWLLRWRVTFHPCVYVIIINIITSLACACVATCWHQVIAACSWLPRERVHSDCMKLKTHHWSWWCTVRLFSAAGFLTRCRLSYIQYMAMAEIKFRIFSQDFWCCVENCIYWLVPACR